MGKVGVLQPQSDLVNISRPEWGKVTAQVLATGDNHKTV